MSSLKIYYSDKIKELAADLKEKLVEERRKSDPFVFSTVVVPNTNIEKWLRVVRFADEPSLCMGIECPFIESALFRILADRLPGKDRPKQHQDGDYAVGILSILLDEKSIMPVSVRVDGMYGLNGTFLSVPAILDHTGVKEIVEIDLQEDELAALHKSAELLSSFYGKLDA